MLLISDVHGAVEPLHRVAAEPGPLLVLGDLINFIDYRTNDGIVAEVSGREMVDEFVRLRARGEHAAVRELWATHSAGRETEIRAAYDRAIAAAYVEICAALEGSEAYVTFGNVDTPELLIANLPTGCRFVDAEVIEIEGLRVGFAGGGMVRIGTAGEVSEETMGEKLDGLGPVDVLCTHVPPAVPELAGDVIGGREKGSVAVLDYLLREQPPHHYFGDIHQPRASTWRVGATVSRNLGYFRATGKAVRHG
jgi:Icc-related predicted phosphoesterase